jgi:hypothetical protein
MFFFSQMSICTSSNLLDGKHDIVVLVMHAAKVYSLVSLKLDGLGLWSEGSCFGILQRLHFLLLRIFMSAWRPSPYW